MNNIFEELRKYQLVCIEGGPGRSKKVQGGPKRSGEFPQVQELL
jgi:hypothetical protein